MATFKDDSGKPVEGFVMNEDTYTVQLIDEQEHLVSLTKSDIREFETGKTSPMPSISKPPASMEA